MQAVFASMCPFILWAAAPRPGSDRLTSKTLESDPIVTRQMKFAREVRDTLDAIVNA